MTRVKRGTVVKKRHKRLLKQTRGFWGQRKNVFKRAKQTLYRAWAFSYVGRKKRKRDFRSLFIVRVGAAARSFGMSYNRFMQALKSANVLLNRKMLAQIAFSDEETFSKIVDVVRGQAL